jgi:hypothetical protein
MVLLGDDQTSLYCPRCDGEWATIALRRPAAPIAGPVGAGYTCVQARTAKDGAVLLRSVDPTRVNPSISAPGYTSTAPVNSICVSGACGGELPVAPYAAFGAGKLNTGEERVDAVALTSMHKRDLYGYISDYKQKRHGACMPQKKRRDAASVRKRRDGCSFCEASALERASPASVSARHEKASKAYRSARAAWIIMITFLVLLGLGLVASAVVVGVQLAKSSQSLRTISGVSSEQGRATAS